MNADLIVTNAVVYTVDSSFTTQQSFAIKNGKFIFVGTEKELFEKYQSDSIYNAQGKFIYPGFYDAHCHFLAYGKSLQWADFKGTKSFDDCINRLLVHVDKYKNIDWILARGWDQNDWDMKEFPNKSKLDSLFPNTPVFLSRIDGHAALVNSKALELAGINENTTLDGGEILTENGRLTGVLIDNAADLVKKLIPDSKKEMIKALFSAQDNCFKVGLTTVSDAGLDVDELLVIDSLQKQGLIKMNMYVMLNPVKKSFDFAQNGHYKTDNLTVCSFKVYADGALGSRGACLKEEYSDQKHHKGFLLSSIDSLNILAKKINDVNFQMNTHCIGDSANKTLLHIYGKYLNENNNKRWRIEHAQVLDSNDFYLFGKYNIIPSVQPTHCTSDMYWATERLGNQRTKFAYSYKTLLNQNGILAAGSDFPIEDINPLFGFYAAVTRKDQELYPENGFLSHEKLTRIEALKSMTIWAAYSNFEENEKGSIEKGKFADFVILEKDIMNEDEHQLFKIKVEKTFIKGVEVYSKK